MNLRGSRRRNRLPGRLVLLGPLLTACTTSVTLPEVLFWEAGLTSVEGVADPVSGNVAMVASTDRTQIGIGIETGPAEARLDWRVRVGSCAAPGDPVGPAAAFPAIQTSADGIGSAETVINRRLTGGSYAAEVFVTDGGLDDVVACADLVRSAA